MGISPPGANILLAEEAPRHAGARSRSRRHSSLFCRTTTRSPTRGAGSAFTCSRAPGRYRALTALTLLAPATPMLLQGPRVRRLHAFSLLRRSRSRAREPVREGRRAFLAQFPSLAPPDDASACSTIPVGFRPSRHASLISRSAPRTPRPTRCIADLIALRRRDPVLRSAQLRGAVDGFVLNDAAFALRLFGAKAGDRLLLVNLGRQLRRRTISRSAFRSARRGIVEGALVQQRRPLRRRRDAPLESEHGIDIPAECAIVLVAERTVRTSCTKNHNADKTRCRRPSHGPHSDPDRAAATTAHLARVAGDQWSRRLRVGHRFGRQSHGDSTAS